MIRPFEATVHMPIAGSRGVCPLVDPIGIAVIAALGNGGVETIVRASYSPIRRAPHGARLVVAGVCMQPGTVRPFFAIAKEINVQFVLAYNQNEFADSLRAIADEDIDVAPMITGEVRLDGVGAAFDNPAGRERHCKHRRRFGGVAASSRERRSQQRRAAPAKKPANASNTAGTMR